MMIIIIIIIIIIVIIIIIIPLWMRVERQAPNYHWLVSKLSFLYLENLSNKKNLQQPRWMKPKRWSLRNSENPLTNMYFLLISSLFYNVPSKITLDFKGNGESRHHVPLVQNDWLPSNEVVALLTDCHLKTVLIPR